MNSSPYVVLVGEIVRYRRRPEMNSSPYVVLVGERGEQALGRRDLGYNVIHHIHIFRCAGNI